MSKLRSLRSRLASLRRTRWLIRWGSALAAVAAAVVVAGLVVFALDYLFELFVVQRVIVMVLAAAGVLAAVFIYVRPAILTRESEIDIALQVESENNIESDLVASLQFESPQAASWGSPQLAGAVIDSVASREAGIDVFRGLSWQTTLTRLGIFAAVAVVAGGLILAYPSHAWVFWERLQLASTHYPSATKIDRVYIGTQLVLNRGDHRAAPQDIRQPQNRPLTFYMVCSGEVINGGKPAPAYTRVSTVDTEEAASTRRFDLEPVTLADRKQMLTTALAELKKAADAGAKNLTTVQTAELATLTAADAAGTAADILDDKTEADFDSWKSQIEKVLADWPKQVQHNAVYRGEAGRLLQPVAYRLYAGDAWTDPARIGIIPLPVVDPVLTPILPAYARSGKERAAEPSARQISVLEGSEVKLQVVSRNKPLRAAWLQLETREGLKRFDLQATTGSKQLEWKLPAGESPLENIQHDTRFVIQVTDTDGLHLEDALQGYIRIRDDRRPTGSLSVVHRVLLPGADPVLEYNVNDDYGIDQVLLSVQVHRQNPVTQAEEESSPAAYNCDIAHAVASADAGGPDTVEADGSAADDAPPPSKTADNAAASEESPGEETPGEAVATPTVADPADATAPPGSLPSRGCVLPIVGHTARTGVASLAAGSLPHQGQYKLSLAGYKLEKGDQVHVSLKVVDYRGKGAGESFETAPLILDISDRNGVLAAVLEADEKSEKDLSSIIQQLLGIGDSP